MTKSPPMTMGESGDDSESKAIAAAVGLQYLPADRPGIGRVRRGPGFSYHDRTGRRVGDRHRQRISRLAIPPAWTDVWIARETDAHLQATGFDQAGRRQYLYHPDWRLAADTAKFERLGLFASPLSRLRARVDSDLLSRSEDWISAALVRLIDESLIRPGNFRNYGANGSVGATTLHHEHLDVAGRVVRLQFEGKSAVTHDIEVRDPLLARRLSDLLDAAGPGQPIFVDDDGDAVDSGRLNDYVRTNSGGDFTAKDLRTWGATCIVAERLARAKVADDAVVRDALEEAALELGNTVQVCRTSYVSPAVIEGFRDGVLSAAWSRSRPTRWLSRAEQTVKRVLAD